ncbi:MAG: PEP-CTERM sorting domain-containing protein, partial [Atribacterota bacterium]|nr:PEP-CTERM sorting domain-containing protein [Atribacterota bacterium]
FGDNVVGSYLDTNNINHGFLYNGKDWATLDPPGATKSYPSGVSGNKVVGSYYTGDTKHGFLYDGTKVPTDPSAWTTFDVPGFTNIIAVSDSNIVGNYQHGNLISGFLYDGKGWITLDMPDATRTNVSDISGNNVIGSYTTSADNYQHSFLCDITDPTKPSWTNIDSPGAKNTLVNAIDGIDIVGYHASSPEQGYFYTIPEPGTIAMLAGAGLFLFFGALKRHWLKR